MLRDEIARYTELSGNDGEHTPIGIIGAFLDGYETGLKDISKREWIPVSERLPEQRTEVLTCSSGGYIEIQSLEDTYWENQKGDWSDFDEVIAWQPLPEPYKGESEDE